MASRTCDGSVLPLVHAEPLEALKPARSSDTINASPCVPLKQNDALFGSRSVG